MQVIDNSTDVIAGHFSRRLCSRSAGRLRGRQASRNLCRASSGRRRAFDGDTSSPAQRVDGTGAPSSRQLSRTLDSAPAKLRGRGDVPPGPAAHARTVVQRARVGGWQ